LKKPDVKLVAHVIHEGDPASLRIAIIEILARVELDALQKAKVFELLNGLDIKPEHKSASVRRRYQYSNMYRLLKLDEEMLDALWYIGPSGRATKEVWALKKAVNTCLQEEIGSRSGVR